MVDARAFWKDFKVGIGLHDSSSALIPYLKTCFTEPFVLISTGTGVLHLTRSINNLFTESELRQDCLCYMSYHQQPVKASRLFAGNEHETETKDWRRILINPMIILKLLGTTKRIVDALNTALPQMYLFRRA